MEVFLLVLYCFIQVQAALSLNCFECYDGHYRACDDLQEMQSCRGNSKQCYSLRYYDLLDDGKEQHGFKKGCLDEKFEKCQDVCQRYNDMEYDDCKVYCCDGDMCNENGFQDLADQSKKTKRSSFKNNDSVNSNSSNQYQNKLNVIAHCLLLFALRFFLT